jgi:hypothetical protein
MSHGKAAASVSSAGSETAAHRRHRANFTTVTVHRIGVLELSSLTAWIIPVTGSPFKINIALWPRYWAKRQRLASEGSVISMVCIWRSNGSRYAEQVRDR